MSARRRLVALAVALMAAASLAPSAAAHAFLDRSDPADGTRLGVSPGQLRLWFSEEVSPRFRLVRVLDEHGRSLGPVALSGEGRLVVADLPTLDKGKYSVYWRVISEDDGHTTGGTLAFGIGEAVGPAASTAGTPDPAPAWREALIRWLDFSFLAGLVGSLVLAGLVLPRARGVARRIVSAASARMLLLGAVSALLAAGAGIARLVDEVLRLPAAASKPGAAADLVFSTKWGWMWLTRETFLLAVLALLLTVRSRPGPALERRGWAAVAAAATAVVAAAHALTSHASALDHASATAVAAEAAHVLAAGAWLGSVAALAVALWPAGSLGRTDARALARACRGPFAECMALSIGLVLATGLYSAGREIASIDGLMTTTYGHVLLIKTGLFLLAGMLGYANYRLLRTLGRRGGGIGRIAGSRPVLLAELAVGAGVFLAAAALASSVPARGPEFAAPLPAQATTRAVTSGDLLFTVSSTPTRVGSNAFSVLAASSRRPPPAPLDSVSLELSRQGERRTVSLTPIAAGRYLGWADLQEPGSWRLAVIAERAGTRIEAPTSWSVGRADPARPVTFSARRLAPIVDVGAALLLGLTVLGAVWLLAGRPGPVAAHPVRPVPVGGREAS
jgi:copper transport protein